MQTRNVACRDIVVTTNTHNIHLQTTSRMVHVSLGFPSELPNHSVWNLILLPPSRGVGLWRRAWRAPHLQAGHSGGFGDGVGSATWQIGAWVEMPASATTCGWKYVEHGNQGFRRLQTRPRAYWEEMTFAFAVPCVSLGRDWMI